VNADDWGRDAPTTDHILECVQHAKISSVSAMVFMEDSERAASIARERGVDAGLHLNLTTPFSARGVESRLRDHQAKIAGFLRFSNIARVLFHPGLAVSFDYVVKAQLDEFQRLWLHPARRIDGHHHMHLCANIQAQRLLPEGLIVRRNFSFAAGEKGLLNRFYRGRQDRNLRRRFRTTDYFFALSPLDPERLHGISALAAHSDVEIMTHPVNDRERGFLLADGLERATGAAIASCYFLCGAGSGISDAAVDHGSAK
jgi:predicted glycoside hydrolase/deacetylase ChbG (UPF0249 family)